MSSTDIRWIQRLENFGRAFERLSEAIGRQELNELERNGLVQRFEFTLELCWKMLKDYLEFEGFQFKPTPKETIREAFRAELIKDAEVLIRALDLRNELSHDYDGKKFERSENEIRESIFPAIGRIFMALKEKASK
jgi:nucleotidyltransferase substrate binding protein (TIGR01987 family)